MGYFLLTVRMLIVIARPAVSPGIYVMFTNTYLHDIFYVILQLNETKDTILNWFLDYVNSFTKGNTPREE